MHWVQSPRNSHFTVSTLTIPHTFHGEPLPFSHSLFLWANFNWLAWSGIWLLLTFRSVNGTELCCSCAIYPWGQRGFESNPAGGHNPQISCNMCFTSPCGWTYDCRTLHTLTLLCVCCVTQHVAGGICLSQMLGWKTAARFTLSYSGLCSNSAEHLLERVSMAKASLYQQEMQFHPRAARLSSSSLHKVALSLCISLSRKCSSPSALSCPCSVADCAFCYRSLPLLWSHSWGKEL